MPHSNPAAALRTQAFSQAWNLISGLKLPAGCALAATGSFARREMTSRSDLDLILLYPQGHEPDPDAVANIWYPIWDAKYHLDYSIRTPQECAQIAAENTAAGFAQLDLAYVAGSKMLVDEARAKLLATWRVQLQRHFDAFVETAIARWRRSGTVAVMTKPDIKNGRGGLRDIQFIRALALGNLCDAPDLTTQRDLLLDTRTLLHEHARRRRDVLDPEFAADIAAELGFTDRYELSAALVDAAAHVAKALERALATARGLVGRRSADTVRKPLDLDVVESGGYVRLARNAQVDDAVLVLRVAAASARTGKPIDPGVWQRLATVPPLPARWSFVCADAFFNILSFPDQTGRVIAELDAHGWWEKIVPGWAHIRGLMPRERSHLHSIDHHTVLTVSRCAQVRASVARPDLLLLAALYHDIGKGYDRPHAQVGAEMVARMAARMDLNLADRSRVQTLVAEHTRLPAIVTHMDPASDAARDALLDAVHFDYLTITLLKVLTRADAEATGPGVWNARLASGIDTVCARALQELQSLTPVAPRVHAAADIALLADAPSKLLTISWRSARQQDAVRVFAVIAAMGWTIVNVRMRRIHDPAAPAAAGAAGADDGLGEGRATAAASAAGADGAPADASALGADGAPAAADFYAAEYYAAEFDVRSFQQPFAAAANEARFIQVYKSGVHSVVPPVEPGPATATWTLGGVIEIRTPDRPNACAAAFAALPECEWLSVKTLGATMVMQAAPRGEVSRAALTTNVTEALVSG